MANLVEPQMKYIAGFRDAEAEYRLEGRRQLTLLDIPSATDGQIMDYFADLLVGRNLAANLIPASSFWLVDRCAFIGSVSIRHGLNDNLRRFGGHIGYMIRPTQRRRGYGALILRLALPIARDLGIGAALVTCDATNVGSRKIIEANGGVFEDEIAQGPDLPFKRRYWIDTGAAQR